MSIGSQWWLPIHEFWVPGREYYASDPLWRTWTGWRTWRRIPMDYGFWRSFGNGIGDVIISPEGSHTPFTARLCFNCTNNMAEYEACIMGLKAAIILRIKFLNVFGDSALVISQIKWEWDMKHLNLIPYKEHVLTLLPHFEEDRKSVV